MTGIWIWIWNNILSKFPISFITKNIEIFHLEKIELENLFIDFYNSYNEDLYKKKQSSFKEKYSLIERRKNRLNKLIEIQNLLKKMKIKIYFSQQKFFKSIDKLILGCKSLNNEEFSCFELEKIFNQFENLNQDKSIALDEFRKNLKIGINHSKLFGDPKICSLEEAVNKIFDKQDIGFGAMRIKFSFGNKIYILNIDPLPKFPNILLFHGEKHIYTFSEGLADTKKSIFSRIKTVISDPKLQIKKHE